jgi:hypothetical protein
MPNNRIVAADRWLEIFNPECTVTLNVVVL